MPLIVVFGSLNMDLVLSVHRRPTDGETLAANDLLYVPGGKGANQAVAAARLGAETLMAGRIGQDPFAGALVASMEAAGVDTRLIQRDQTPTGIAVITVDGQGQNSIVIVAGANGQVSLDDARGLADVLPGAACLLLQLEIPLPTVVAAARAAASAGVPVILTPAPAQPLPRDLIALTDWLVPNATEAAVLTGEPVEGPDGAARAGRMLQAQGARNVIVTLGGAGVVVVTGDRVIHLPPFMVPVVDTTAAGDTFVGAFATQLFQGVEAVDAARFACAAAALAVGRKGAQSSMPSRREVLAFLAQRRSGTL